MKKIYVSEPTAINGVVMQALLPADYQVVYGTPSFDGDVEGCSVLVIRSETTITRDVTEAFPGLEHIIRIGVGVDNIDMEFCNEAGIFVYNAPGANADAVSDYIVGMMLYGLRNLHVLTRQDVETWNRFKFTGHSMSNRRIGIIGFGNIGKQIFSKLQGFNCKDFLVYDPYVQAGDLPAGVTYASSVEEVLQGSDIVTLHVPLLPSTQYLINKDNLGLLSDSAILINASRGGIVNEADVIAHMREHSLLYIADTVEHEPHVSKALLDTPQAIITPHIASLTVESDDKMVEVAVQNFLQGKPMNKPAKTMALQV